MILHNCIGLETRHGYRTFELYEGDLTEPDAAADLLVVSAYSAGYDPIPGTVLGAVHERWGLDLREVRKDLDVRTPLGFWISAELQCGNFKRVLCVEILGGPLSIGDAIGNVFLALALADAKGVAINTVALPLLGAGNQGIPADKAMAALVPAVRRALEQNFSLKRILFVEKDTERAAALSEALNRLLGRPRVELPKGRLVVDLKLELCARLDQELVLNDVALFREMRRLLAQDDVRSFEIGMLARRLVEFVVDDLLGRSSVSESLAARIARLREKGVASWIQSYMHTLRFFGNESAHEKSIAGQRPPYVSEDDLAICLFCVQRLIDFWMMYGTARQGDRPVSDKQ